MGSTWADWHKAYDDPSSALSARLRAVQQLIREAIDRRPPGPVRMISVCAGQGHDVIGALQGHPRCKDVSAALIELDDQNVHAARERIAAAGLSNVSVIQGDASYTDVYSGRVPADVLLLCGLFGNLSEEDIERTIGYLPMLCAAGATVLWTRGGFLAEHIRRWFTAAGFDEVAYAELPAHSVGANRFFGKPIPLESGIRLFTFRDASTLQATEDTLSIRGLRVHYRVWGDPDRPVLVLLHGLRASADVWWSVALALDGWRLIAPDQRGHGDSDWAPDGNYSHEACLLDLEELVDRLGLESFALLGHATGGVVAAAYALRHPRRVQKLVLEEIGTGIRADLSELPLAFDTWEAAAAYLRGRNPKMSEPRLENILPHLFRELNDGTITWKYDLAGMRKFDSVRTNGFDPWAEIGHVDCPVLIMRGGKSDVVADEAIRAMNVAHLEWVDIPGAAHNAHVENASAFNRELQRFLNRA